MSKEIKAESKAKIAELNRKDQERIALEAARNQVESYCYLIKNKLADEEEKIAQVTTEEQREEIRQLGADATDWLDFESQGADLETLQAKFKELSEPAEKIWFRMKEMAARPAAITSMNEMLSKVEDILKKWTTSMPHITEEERADVTAKMEEIKKWMEEKAEEQDSKAPHEEPAFTSAEVPLQSKSLERLMNKLSKKPKPKPPKKNETAKANNETEAESVAADEGNETKAEEAAPEGDGKEKADGEKTKEGDDEL